MSVVVVVVVAAVVVVVVKIADVRAVLVAETVAVAVVAGRKALAAVDSSMRRLERLRGTSLDSVGSCAFHKEGPDDRMCDEAPWLVCRYFSCSECACFQTSWSPDIQ